MHTKRTVPPNRLPAHIAVEAIRCGRLSSFDLTLSCLERIEAREASVGAWSYLDRDYALEQACRADEHRRAGAVLGPLHGLPIGIKDVFDTFDMPSEYGSPSLKDRRPAADADAVTLLRAAGAVIMGKTVTSEFGMYALSSCRNPHDQNRSPGVSSAGSAAAVADAMVPLALGTQHTASTLLPASFCGVFGFKPSFAFTSMRGSNVLVPRLATVGLLARNLDDLALFASALAPGFKVSVRPLQPQRFGVVRGPAWHQVAADARAALCVFLRKLPVAIADLELPVEFDRAVEVTYGLLAAHLAHRFAPMPEATQKTYCGPLRAAIATGLALSATNYLRLEEQADRLTAAAHGLFASCDVLITLASLGEASLISDGPGSGELTMPWSLAGLPTLSLPLLKGDRGLPIGVQLVGAPGDDQRLLSIAAWLNIVCQKTLETAQSS